VNFEVGKYYYNTKSREHIHIIGRIVENMHLDDEVIVAECLPNFNITGYSGGLDMDNYGWVPDAPWKEFPNFDKEGTCIEYGGILDLIVSEI